MTPGIQVWWAPERLADDPSAAPRLRALLSDSELEQQRAFRADSPRRLHLIARGMQRTVLSRLVPSVAPRDWNFEHGTSGRPALAAGHGMDLDFNIAHTSGLVVLAVGARMRLGVDVEALGPRRAVQIARRYFSEREIASLERLPPADQARRFVELWTLKEAFLKAVGTGISGGLGTMTFEPGPDGIEFDRPSDPDAALWRFHQRPLGPEHLLALAWRATAEPAQVVTCHEFDFDATPQTLDS